MIFKKLAYKVLIQEKLEKTKAKAKSKTEEQPRNEVEDVK
jgi:hypothetical protein